MHLWAKGVLLCSVVWATHYILALWYFYYLYNVTWSSDLGPRLDYHNGSGHTYDGWRSMGRPNLSLIPTMISAKSTMPHEITAPLIVGEALVRSVSFISSNGEHPPHRTHSWPMSIHKLAWAGIIHGYICTDEFSCMGSIKTSSTYF